MNIHYKTLNTNYQEWLSTLGYSEATVYGHPKRLDHFFRWQIKRNKNNISTLTREDVKNYFQYLETRPHQRRKGLVGVAHINQTAFAIDKFLEFLHQTGMKNAPSPLNYRLKVDETERLEKITLLTQNQIKTLRENIENTHTDWFTYAQRQAKHYQLKLVFALYYGCGLRRSEGYKLQLKDINLNKGEIFVRQGKNYKDRIVPMSENVYRDVEDYIYNFRSHFKSGHYYHRTLGNRLFVNTSGCLLKSLYQLQKVANVLPNQPITFHSLRHSIATHLLQNGMEMENIKLFLGHSSLETTQLYTHIVNQNKV